MRWECSQPKQLESGLERELSAQYDCTPDRELLVRSDIVLVR
jgi:hypothetical protein